MNSFLRVSLAFIILCSALFCAAEVVQAGNPYNDGTVGPDEEIFNDLFLQGNQVIVEGKIHGMLVATAESILIRSGAEIDDDAFLFGRTVQLEKGAILNGNVYVGAQNVQVDSQLSRSLFVGAATLDLGENSRLNNNLFFGGFHLLESPGSSVNRNLYAGAYQVILNGTIGQDVNLGAAALEINGAVNGNVNVSVDSESNPDATQYWLPYMSQYNVPEALTPGLRIGDKAMIKGKLTYSSATRLDEAFKALPLGGVIFNPSTPQNQTDINVSLPNIFQNRLLRALRLWISLLLLGAAALWLLPNLLKEASQQAANKPLQAAGVGVLSMAAVYFGAFILFGLVIFLSVIMGIFTLNGLGRSLFGLGSATLTWILVVFSLLVAYGSKLIVAHWLGNLLLHSLFPNKPLGAIWPLFSGITLFILINTIPVLGWLVSMLVTIIGLGALWYTYKAHQQVGVLANES